MPDRAEPVWLAADVALAVHDRQLAEHGGGVGVRDAGLLESALARPVNRWNYGEDDRCALAAAYAFGMARNQPFESGNNRTAWVLARLFLAINDVKMVRPSYDAICTMLAPSAGELAEEALADWFREHVVVI